MQRSTDQTLLVQIALGDKDANVRGAAAQRITEQAGLAKIAVGSLDTSVRLSAASKVTDEAVLIKLAIEDKDAGVRSAALTKLTSDASLETVKTLLDGNHDIASTKDESGAPLLVWAVTSERNYGLLEETIRS